MFYFFQNNLYLFLLFLGLAYFFGVLSNAHYVMLGNSYYIGLWVTLLVSVALLFGLRAFEIKRIGISTMTWVGLGFVIAIQPFINSIVYADSLIFPIGFLVVASILSVVVVNVPMDKRHYIINGAAWLFLIVGLLNVITQFIQLFYPNQFSFISRVPLPLSRSTGNIAQPNQASFLAVLSSTCVFYLFYRLHKDFDHYKNQKIIIFFLTISLFFLTAAIALTLSRTGLVLFALALIGALFYTWNSCRWRLGFLGASSIVSVLGYQFGSRLGRAFLSMQDVTGLDRLMATSSELRGILWERAWLAFESSPIIGIGYNNYYWYGWDNIERWTWFENADNAHNVILQIAGELGLLGLAPLLGVIAVFLYQVIAFLQRRLLAQDLFLCSMLMIFVAYSFSEFPLWYPFFCFSFVLFVGLLDKGIIIRRDIKKLLMTLVVILSSLAALYTGLYRYYLIDYEIVLEAQVDNQQKIDAYHRFPVIFGFTKAKEYMLHTIVDDENTGNTNKFIQMGDRLMRENTGLDVMRIQTRLLMRYGEQARADKLNRALCVWEYQSQVQNSQAHNQCAVATEAILKIDPNDTMGYAKRLNDWYTERYGDD